MCSTGARESANRLELAVHDVGIDEADPWMLEGFAKAAHDFEARLQPQLDGALVVADHKIRLHGTETSLPRAFQRVRAHRTSYAAARRVRRGHVAAIRHMRAAPSLIGLQEVAADDFGAVFRDKDFVARQ